MVILRVSISILLMSLVKCNMLVSTSNHLGSITPISNCKAKLDSGQLIDLTSLDNPSNPKTTSKDGYNYNWNPCTPIKCGPLIPYTSAICQTDNAQENYNLGKSSQVNFLSWDDSTQILQIVYFDGTGGRKSNVNCQCSQSDSFSYVGERPSLVYTFTLQSKCCCPDGCKGKVPDNGGSESGLTGGSIFLIILFVLLSVYLIGGVVIMKFVRKSNGMDLIPNVQIWISFGDHIKEGLRFSKDKITGRSNYSRI